MLPTNFHAVIGNIIRNISYTATFVEDALKTKDRRTRSRYYRAAYINIASAIEASLWLNIEKYCRIKKLPFKEEVTDPKYICEISAAIGIGNLAIYEKRTRQPVNFLEVQEPKFKELTDFAKRHKLLDRKVLNAIERVRQRRNLLHIHGNTTSDTGYTGKQVTSLMQLSQVLIRNLQHIR